MRAKLVSTCLLLLACLIGTNAALRMVLKVPGESLSVLLVEDKEKAGGEIDDRELNYFDQIAVLGNWELSAAPAHWHDIAQETANVRSAYVRAHLKRGPPLA